MPSRGRPESTEEEDAAAGPGVGGPGGRVPEVLEVPETPEPPRRLWTPGSRRSAGSWRSAAGRAARFAAANCAFWCVAFSSCRLYCLLTLSLALVVTTATLRQAVPLPGTRVMGLWNRLTRRWKLIDPGPESGDSETEPPLSETFRLFLQETSCFKQQNPGKFCLLVCSLCTFFAVLGRYIPGMVVSYILILGVFLWPLVSSQEFAAWLKPVLQKLDFGFGEFLRKIKDNHEKRLLQEVSDKESIEADLSSMFPKLDSAVCKDMCVSDTEASEVTWTDNGTFNLSEGHTPQTDNSEDLDKEEAFIGGLPEFPSLDNGAGTNGDDYDDDDDLSIGLPTPPTRHSRQPIRSKHSSAAPPPRDPADRALELVNRMASDAIAAAVTAAIQERIEAAVGMAIPATARLPEGTVAAAAAAARAALLLPIALAEASESDSEVEDFELLDQSELEQELGLETQQEQQQEQEQQQQQQTPEQEGGDPPGGDPPSPKASASAGFFSKLMGRH